MAERDFNWGPDADGADFQMSVDGDQFVVAQTLDANGDVVDVLLEYDDSTDEWTIQGPVDFGGTDVTNIGSATIDDSLTVPEAEEGDSADERQLAVSPDDELLIATEQP